MFDEVCKLTKTRKEMLVVHPDYNKHGFFVSAVGADSFVVVPFGANIFSYSNVVEKSLKSFAQKLHLFSYTAYIDLLHISSATDIGVVKIEDNLNNKEHINWLDSTEIQFEDLPNIIKNEIVRIYKEREENIRPLLLLSSKERFDNIKNNNGGGDAF